MASPIVTNTGASLNGKRLSLYSDFPVYRPEDYGAVGDGVTDDTAAIQNCINAAKATGGTVLFGVKVYGITNTLTYDQAGGRPIQIIGQGKILDLIIAGTAGTEIRCLGSTPFTRMLDLRKINGVRVQGLVLNCRNPAFGILATTGLYIGAATGCVIDSIEVHSSSGFAFDFEATTGGVYRNTFSNLSTNSAILGSGLPECNSGMKLRSTDIAVNNVNVASNTFTECSFYYDAGIGVDIISADNNLFAGLIVNKGAFVGNELIVLRDKTANQFGACFNTFVALDGGGGKPIRSDVSSPNVNICYGLDFQNGISGITGAHPENFVYTSTLGIVQAGDLIQIRKSRAFVHGTEVPLQIYYDSNTNQARFQNRDPLALGNRGFIFSTSAAAGAEQTLLELDSIGRVYERGRTTAMGDYVFPAHSVNNFWSTGGVPGPPSTGWTTVAGTTKVGIKRGGTSALMKFNITGTTVTLAGSLIISLIPWGLVVGAGMNYVGVIRVVDNAAAAAAGLATAIAGDNKITITLMAGTGFAASGAGATAISGDIEFETAS